jgi:catechol 2,3-dioxygenase-like lactoylglutathione lyase family enzyme
MIRRAIPVIVVPEPDEAREFYEGFLGVRVAMDEAGMTMFASTTIPTTQLIVVWPSPTAVDPALADVDVSFEVDDDCPLRDSCPLRHAPSQPAVHTFRPHL